MVDMVRPGDDPTDGPFGVGMRVGPEYRRRGIATALLAEAARRCAEGGLDSLSLRIDSRHTGAKELYSVLGFDHAD